MALSEDEARRLEQQASHALQQYSAGGEAGARAGKRQQLVYLTTDALVAAAVATATPVAVAGQVFTAVPRTSGVGSWQQHASRASGLQPAPTSSPAHRPPPGPEDPRHAPLLQLCATLHRALAALYQLQGEGGLDGTGGVAARFQGREQEQRALRSPSAPHVPLPHTCLACCGTILTLPPPATFLFCAPGCAVIERRLVEATGTLRTLLSAHLPAYAATPLLVVVTLSGGKLPLSLLQLLAHRSMADLAARIELTQQVCHAQRHKREPPALHPMVECREPVPAVARMLLPAHLPLIPGLHPPCLNSWHHPHRSLASSHCWRRRRT
jgi:hypothetical protein